MAQTPSSNPSNDRNILLGILAVQMDFVHRDDLLAAMTTWVQSPSTSLGARLVELGHLTPERLHLLSALVEEQLRKQKEQEGNNEPTQTPPGWLMDCLQDLNGKTPREPAIGLPPPEAFDSTLGPSMRSISSTGPRYRIVRRHARGGVGEVYVAEDMELNRKVALKEIREELSENLFARERFVLEAEVTGGLEHPGIVPIYGLGAYDDGRPFYAMRFIQGETLREAIQRFHEENVPAGKRSKRANKRKLISEHNLEFRQLLGRFVNVCNTIAYAHSRGILHRDLKPDNIMLGKYGETLIVDWGLAKTTAKVRQEQRDGTPEEPTLHLGVLSGSPVETRMGSIVGTPTFMSPEQALGKTTEVGPTTDIYSLGATLYVLLTGRVPYEKEDLSVILRKVQLGEFPPPSHFNPNIPKALEAICLKAMAHKSGNRYQSSLEMAEDIENWLAGEAVKAYPEPWRMRTRRWLRKHPALASGAAVALFVGILALSGGMVWYQQVQAEKYAEEIKHKTEVDRQQARAEQGVKQSLDQVQEQKKKLAAVLAEPGGVFKLVNDPGEWRRQIFSVRQSLQQARDRQAAFDGKIDQALQDRMAVENNWLRQHEKNYQLALKLEQIREEKNILVQGNCDYLTARTAYPKAFQEFGVKVGQEDLNHNIHKIKASEIRDLLVSALDDWALADRHLRTGQQHVQELEILLKLAKLSDSSLWKDALRDPTMWQIDKQKASKVLDELVNRVTKSSATSPEQEVPSPRIYQLLGSLLELYQVTPNPEEPTLLKSSSFLKDAQSEYPGDFWLAFQLGQALAQEKNYQEAANYFRVAMTIRPRCPAVQNNLGVVLLALNDQNQAIWHFRKARSDAPDNGRISYNLGLVLKEKGQLEPAIAQFQHAVQRVREDIELQKSASMELQKCQQALANMPKEKVERFNARLGRLEIKGELSKDDPLDSFLLTKDRFHKSHLVHLEGGKIYQVDLQGDFDTFLRVENNKKEPLLFNDDVNFPEKNKNSRLIFIPENSGDYRFVISTFGKEEVGKYTLHFQEAKKVGLAEVIEDRLTENDPVFRGSFAKEIKVDLVGGKPYTIELQSKEFDTYLRLIDPGRSNILVTNDDIVPGNLQQSRIDFTPKDGGKYILMISSYVPRQTGAYTVRVQGYEPNLPENRKQK